MAVAGVHDERHRRMFAAQTTQELIAAHAARKIQVAEHDVEQLETELEQGSVRVFDGAREKSFSAEAVKQRTRLIRIVFDDEDARVTEWGH